MQWVCKCSSPTKVESEHENVAFTDFFKLCGSRFFFFGFRWTHTWQTDEEVEENVGRMTDDQMNRIARTSSSTVEWIDRNAKWELDYSLLLLCRVCKLCWVRRLVALSSIYVCMDWTWLLSEIGYSYVVLGRIQNLGAPIVNFSVVPQCLLKLYSYCLFVFVQSTKNLLIPKYNKTCRSRYNPPANPASNGLPSIHPCETSPIIPTQSNAPTTR